MQADESEVSKIETLKILGDLEEGDYVFWKSKGVSKLRLRLVIRADIDHIYLQDHLFYNRRGRCVSDYRHGGLLDPTVDHIAKYTRQQRRFADTDRIHEDRLHAANREYRESLDQWALETVRDLADVGSEEERVELLLEAAQGYTKLGGGSS